MTVRQSDQQVAFIVYSVGNGGELLVIFNKCYLFSEEKQALFVCCGYCRIVRVGGVAEQFFGYHFSELFSWNIKAHAARFVKLIGEVGGGQVDPYSRYDILLARVKKMLAEDAAYLF